MVVYFELERGREISNMTRAMGHFLRPNNFAKSFLFHGKINHLCLYAVLSLLYFNKFHPQYIPARVDAIMTSRRVNVTQISWTIKYFEDQVIWRLMNGKGMDDDGHLSRTFRELNLPLEAQRCLSSSSSFDAGNINMNILRQ